MIYDLVIVQSSINMFTKDFGGNMVTMLALPLVLLVLTLFHAEGFVAPAPFHQAKQATLQQIGWRRQQQHQHQHQSLLLQMSSKEEEIAELEAKLRQLKQETLQQQEQAVKPPSVASTTFSKKKEEEEDFEVPEDIMLSERWKETVVDSSDGGGASPLVTALGAVALVIGLAFFAQVPIGQEDLSKYTAIETTTQIDLGDLNRARKAGDL
jgi:TolA-binding protein